MTMTKFDRDYIMLYFALIECRRAIDTLSDVDQLSAKEEEHQPGVVVYENLRIFDRIRLGLQMAANVSRLFWPPSNKARGKRLRLLTGLPDTHGLADRRLRNHIEHMDERLDDWTANSPRPFLTIELALPDFYPDSGAERDAAVNATAIVYDVAKQNVHLFGEVFSLTSLRSDLEDVIDKVGEGMVQLSSGSEWTTPTP